MLSRAKLRDSQAWSELVDLYGPLVSHWSLRCGLSRQQAADCVQEVFASVARSLGGYQAQRENGSFRAWLWTITCNKAKDVYRRDRYHPVPPGGSTALANLEQLAEEEEIPAREPTDADQLSQLVSRGLAQVQVEFQPRTWDMFRRVVIDQLPTGLVAEEFRVSPAAVRQARSRVLRRLRQQLGDLEDPSL